MIRFTLILLLAMLTTTTSAYDTSDIRNQFANDVDGVVIDCPSVYALSEHENFPAPPACFRVRGSTELVMLQIEQVVLLIDSFSWCLPWMDMHKGRMMSRLFTDDDRYWHVVVDEIDKYAQLVVLQEWMDEEP